MTLTRTVLLALIAVVTVGLCTGVLLTVDAYRDRDAVNRRNVRNGRRLVSRYTLIAESLRLVGWVGLTLIVGGMTASLWAAKRSGPLLVTRAGVLVVAITLLAQSLTVYRLRRRLFDEYRLDDRETKAPVDAS